MRNKFTSPDVPALTFTAKSNTVLSFIQKIQDILNKLPDKSYDRVFFPYIFCNIWILYHRAILVNEMQD